MDLLAPLFIGGVSRLLSSSHPKTRGTLIRTYNRMMHLARRVAKMPRRIARRLARDLRSGVNQLFIRLMRAGVKSTWISKGVLATSPEYASDDADVWLGALERVMNDQPGTILRHRRGAFYRAWCGGDISRSMAFMDQYRLHQVSLRAEVGLTSTPVAITRDIFTSNYAVHAFLDTHLKAMMLGWAPERTIIAPLSSKSRVWNPVMTRYWSRYVTTVQLGDREPPALAALDSLFNEDLTIAATINGKSVYIEHAKAQVQTEWERQGRSPLLTFDEEDAATCAEVMETIGLPTGAPFVTLHVRDNGSKTGSWENAGSSDDFRNADILTYLNAVELITQRGWYVVRVGDPAMKPVPQHPGLIDYAHSSIRSNLLDVYLSSQCRFFIGTSSGPILIPHVFGTPILGTNYAPISGRLHAGNSLLLLKRLRHKSGRYATIAEALGSRISSLFLMNEILLAGYVYEDNSCEELASGVSEMLETLDGTICYSPTDELRQATLNQLYHDLSGYGSLGRLSRAFVNGCSQRGMF